MQSDTATACGICIESTQPDRKMTHTKNGAQRSATAAPGEPTDTKIKNKKVEPNGAQWKKLGAQIYPLLGQLESICQQKSIPLIIHNAFVTFFFWFTPKPIHPKTRFLLNISAPVRLMCPRWPHWRTIFFFDSSTTQRAKTLPQRTFPWVFGHISQTWPSMSYQFQLSFSPLSIDVHLFWHCRFSIRSQITIISIGFGLVNSYTILVWCAIWSQRTKHVISSYSLCKRSHVEEHIERYLCSYRTALLNQHRTSEGISVFDQKPGKEDKLE